MDDPSGAGEVIFTIVASLFGLFLLVALASSFWHYLVRTPAKRLHDRARPAHERLAEALPPPRTPEAARRELLAATGGLQELTGEVRRRLLDRGREILTREPKEEELKKWTTELTKELLHRWATASGEVPLQRADLPPRSFQLSCDPRRFVRDWNEQDWLHDDEHGPLTLDGVRAGPMMTPERFVEWNVERWAWELEQQVGLNCWDVLFVPLFAFGIFAALLSVVLPDLVSWAGAAILVVPFMWWWARARRRGYIAFGDD